MFESLTNKFSDVFRKMSGRGKISEANIREAMKEVRNALLEADVNYKVVKKFCDDVTEKAIGQEVIQSLKPDQLMVKIVHDELVNLMGPVDTRIYFVSPGPTVIMMAGLQGAGKTTTSGKLAKFIKAKGRRPLMVACDLQRPAAVEQLSIVGEQVGVDTFKIPGEKNPVRVARKAVEHAKATGHDVVIVDTAGRLHVDEEMMKQAEDISAAVNPHQIYLVCDAMTGQDAVNSAKEFNERLELDGVILTKFDSDARGGAALSVKSVTSKPIKFIGVGEKLGDLEEFHADRMAGRILGMGDVVSLVEKAQEAFDEDQAQEMQEKMAKGTFTLTDFMSQMKKIKKMGPLRQILKLIPGMGANIDALGDQLNGDEIKHMEAIINSMTPAERENPSMVEASRRRRIARGSGREVTEVSSLIKSFTQMSGMMKQMASPGMGMRQKMAMMSDPAAMMGGAMGGKKLKQRSKRLTAKQKKARKKRKKRR